MKVQDLIDQITTFFPDPERDEVLSFNIKGRPFNEKAGRAIQTVQIKNNLEKKNGK
jgi:hypothetical protein